MFLLLALSLLRRRFNKPEVEVRMNKELLMNSVVICRTDKEKCLIEPSINSVRVSICIKQLDELDKVLADRFSRFLMQRAEEFSILRRKAMPVCFSASDPLMCSSSCSLPLVVIRTN